MAWLKRLLSLWTAIGLCLCLSACWNYQDVDELYVVSGFAIDKDMSDGSYIISFEIIKAKPGQDSQMAIDVFSVRSETVFSAIRAAIKQLGSKLYWGHATVCIISDTVALDGLFTALDTLARGADLKADIFICYSESESLKALFNTADKMHDSASGHLVDLFNESETAGTFISAPLYRVIKDLSSDNGTTLLPVLEISNQDDEEKLLVNGSAVIERDGFVGYLNDEETRSTQILRNPDFKKGYELSVKANSYIPAASVEVLDSDIKIDPVLEDGQLSLMISLSIDGALVELQSDKDYISDERKTELENGFEQLLRYQIDSIIERAQRDLKTDIFGFDQKVLQGMPSFYHSASADWQQFFSSMIVKTHVSINISSSESNMKPLGYGE